MNPGPRTQGPELRTLDPRNEWWSPPSSAYAAAPGGNTRDGLSCPAWQSIVPSMPPERQFLVDEKGKARAVVLPIDEYRRLLEKAGDAEDLALIESRRSEPDIFVKSVDELDALLAGD